MMQLVYLPEKELYRINLNIPNILAKLYKSITRTDPKKQKNGRAPKKTREYAKFLGQVYTIWGHKCIKCGVKKRKSLTVHHIYSYTKYPNLRLDPDFALPLCKKCHQKFHRKYHYDFGPDELFEFVWKEKKSFWGNTPVDEFPEVGTLSHIIYCKEDQNLFTVLEESKNLPMI